MKTSAAILVLLALAGCSTPPLPQAPLAQTPPPQALISGLVRDSAPFPEFSIANSESSGFRTAKAIVRSVLGDVQYGNGGVWNPIRLNMELANGTLIRTGHGASAFLSVNVLTSTIKVEEDSELDLTEMMAWSPITTRTALEVRKGMILGTVRKLSPESSFQVRGGGVTLKVHGTDFKMSAEGRVEMPTGAGIVTTDGISFQLPGGEYFDPGKNEVGNIPPPPVLNYMPGFPGPPPAHPDPPVPVSSWPGAEPLSPFERGLENARLRSLGQ